MRRIDIEPSDEQLLDLLEPDPFGRVGDLNEFAELIAGIEGSFSLFLDADWGAGKTIFIRQFKRLLEMANSTAVSEESVKLFDQDGKFSSFGKCSSILPVYYNAWEHDHWDDPLASIALSIAKEFELENDLRTYPPIDKANVAALLSEVLTGLHLGVTLPISRLVESASSDDPLKDYKTREELRESVSNLIDAILPEKANTLLLIIDELDRCKPPFALKVLEEVKNLFHSDRVIVLYAVNSAQLAHSVRGAYGSEFDGERYLSRFYDLLIKLPIIPEDRYFFAGQNSSSHDSFERNTLGLAKSCKMTARDMNRYSAEISKVRDALKRNYTSESVDSFARWALVPTVLAMKVVDPRSYEAVCKRQEVTPLVSYVKQCEQIESFTRKKMAESGFRQKRSFGDYSPEDVESFLIIPADLLRWFHICLHPFPTSFAAVWLRR